MSKQNVITKSIIAKFQIDMVEDGESRWLYTNNNDIVPRRIGRIRGLEKFDSKFFGIGYKQAHSMDPQNRILLEAAYEAIVDAGVNPVSIKNKNVGVYIGSCFSEAEKTWMFEKVLKVREDCSYNCRFD
jgi:fatty acid synthase